jgi:myo-inositol-1-phosphate synthase
VNGLKAKIAIAGVGNCASVFLQGLRFYSGKSLEGLWHPVIGGLRPRDVDVAAAFDIDSRKVGLELSQAAFAPPNVARKYMELPGSKTMVSPGISKGDPAPHLRGATLQGADPKEVSARLEASGAEILVNLISSGSDASAEAYAEAALRAGCAFVNCTPSLILKRRKLAAGFRRSRLPLVGDDLMSQFGGTVFHKGLLNLMVKRGVRVSKSYQLDVGGGSETLNTMDEGIKMAKRKLKTTSVASEVPYKFETVAGTTDFVDYMGNDRTSYFWFDGSGFLKSGISVDVYLRSSDGANAGNVLLDVVRATHRARKSGKLAGVEDICAYGFKSPPQATHFAEAYAKFTSRYL